MLYTMLPASIIPKWGSTVVTGYGMLIGGIFLFFTTGYWNYHVNFNLPLFLGSAAIILIGTALAFTLYLQGVSAVSYTHLDVYKRQGQSFHYPLEEAAQGLPGCREYQAVPP